MSPDRLRIGVVGAGGIASRHIGNLVEDPRAAVVAVADPALARAEEQAARAGARPYADWRAMLDGERLDALLVCVPPFAHGPPETAAAELGLPFFVEKPIAADLDTAERIGRAVEQARLVTAVGYHWRSLDITDRAAELLAERPAHLVTGYWLDATPPRDWWVRRQTSGGQIVEQTTHVVDLARRLVGEPAAVAGLAAHVARREPAFPESDADVADATIATVRIATGAIGSFTSTSLLRWPHQVALHLVGEGMVLELSEFELMVDVGRGRQVIAKGVDPFRAELGDFLTAVGGGPNGIRAPFAEALRTQRVTIAMTEATETGRTIELTGGPEAGPVAGRRAASPVESPTEPAPAV